MHEREAVETGDEFRAVDGALDSEREVLAKAKEAARAARAWRAISTRCGPVQ